MCIVNSSQYGLGTRNKREERLIEFCQQNELIITNTYFKQHPRKLYTWKSSDGDIRNQIDYILINERFRNCVKLIRDQTQIQTIIQ